MKRFVEMLKETFSRWSDDESPRLGAALAWALERMAPESALLWRVYGRMVFSCRVRGVEWGRREFPDAGI
ncbi:MAG: hypothetical protein BWZ10_02064 [candidate division BRC1 bacterium ADurb.BinA364]|nr:MAG: hypothetical protein BWZ10_02064 [candidate division BRC1 bacterium ADurb.BinA364]